MTEGRWHPADTPGASPHGERDRGATRDDGFRVSARRHPDHEGDRAIVGLLLAGAARLGAEAHAQLAAAAALLDRGAEPCR